MILQAAGLALLAALSPTTLLVSAVYLGSARPRLVAAAYLAGAQCAWNCRRCGSGILIRLVSSMARAKIARNLS